MKSVVSKYPRQKVIAVDVDGTLSLRGQPNTKLIEWCKAKASEGFSLMLWSSQGEQHARDMADRFGCADLFHVICSKPGAIVDDKGWGWIKYTTVVRGFQDCEDV